MTLSRLLKRAAALVLFAIPSLAAQIPDTLVERLADSESNVRRKAVLELAKHSGTDAVELMLKALADPSPRVADTAQWELPSMLSTDSIKLLTGKQGSGSKQTLVRLRAVEALGRIEFDFDSSWAIAAIKSKDSRTRAATLWSLERLLRNRRLKSGLGKKTLAQVKKRLKDKSGLVRGAALSVLDAAGPGLTFMELTKHVEKRNPPAQRAAAVQIACRDNQDDSKRLLVLSGLLDDDLSVRTCAVEAIGQNPDRGLVTTLALQLEIEQSLRLRWTIVRVLRELSGRKYGINPQSWQNWTHSLEEDWKKPKKQAQGNFDSGESTSSFAGLRVLSKRVCILIDFSGSIWKNGKNGTTRKAAVDIELRKALESLPKDAMFNLIPYTGKPMPWKDKLVRADKGNIRRAMEWFEKLNAVGQGNFWDALQLALEDQDVDTIIALTDGAPSGGERWDLKLMGPLLAERNRFKRVVLDAILVDSPSFLVSMWRDMCAESGGRVVEIDL